MARYFLHVQDRSDLIEDPDGEVFHDATAAWHEAGAVAREMMAQALHKGEPLGLHRLVLVDDEEGRRVATVSFLDALPAEELEEIETYDAEQAALAIVRLINSQPQSPRPEDISAILRSLLVR